MIKHISKGGEFYEKCTLQCHTNWAKQWNSSNTQLTGVVEKSSMLVRFVARTIMMRPGGLFDLHASSQFTDFLINAGMSSSGVKKVV